MYEIDIYVSDGEFEDVHTIYNQTSPWTEEQCRAWVAKTVYDPCTYTRHENRKVEYSL